MTATLFDPVQLGDIPLANRVVMAPMTRSRAGPGDAPTGLNVEYYRQRASAGLIVSEGVQPSANGKGYCRTPGLHTEAQVAGWKAVTDAATSGDYDHLLTTLDVHCEHDLDGEEEDS